MIRILVIAALLLAAILVALGGPGGVAPVSGGACSPIGSTQQVEGKTWTCARNVETGKGYWYVGTP